jgi:protein-disulfide isomerase
MLMTKMLRWALTATALTLLPAAAVAAEFTDKQKDEIGQIVRDYLLAHPEVLVEMSKKLEAQQREEEDKQRSAGVKENAGTLFHQEGDLVGGNPQGDVTMVEFFDYNCGWCKKGLPEVLSLINEDNKLRLVMKEFPIFGGDSDYAAKAALASRQQGKYWQFHVALLSHEGKVTKEAVDQIAKDQGLDLDQLKKDMEAPEVAETIARNQSLATKLAISGTPAFIIESKVIPGYLPADGLAATIKDVRDAGGCTVC